MEFVSPYPVPFTPMLPQGLSLFVSYDLAADPTEQQELAGVYSNRVNTLESLWGTWAATNNVLR